MAEASKGQESFGEGLEWISTRSLDCQEKTLRAGIIVGAIGAFAVILAPQIMQLLVFGPSYSQALGAILNLLFQLVTLFFLPFSAALIAAFLVMRHLDTALGRSMPSQVGGPPPTE